MLGGLTGLLVEFSAPADVLVELNNELAPYAMRVRGFVLFSAQAY